MTSPDRVAEIYRIWFAAPDDPGYVKGRELWFKGGPEFDETLRQKIPADHECAMSGALDAWRDDWRGCLALILLLDQSPRNMFRGSVRSFASDAKPLGIAWHALAAVHAANFAPVAKCFFYLPFEHSEALENQDRCVSLFKAMPAHKLRNSWTDCAVKHHDMITRFGRFPHRDEILGRACSEEERTFLAETGLHFGTAPNRPKEC